MYIHSLPTRKRALGSFRLAVVLISVTLPSLAQDYKEFIGAPPSAQIMPVELGFINLGTGNLHLEIPLGAFPQRGGVTLTANLVYDSRIWQVTSVYPTYTPGFHPTNIPTSQGGWQFVISHDSSKGGVFYAADRTTCGDPYSGGYGNAETFSNFGWTAPDGVVHYFSTLTTNEEFGPDFPCLGDTSSASGAADDMSGFYMVITNYTSAVVYAKDGTQVYPQIKDSNGNYYSNDSSGNVIDTLGRVPVTVTNNGNITYYDVLNSQGTRSRYTVTFTSVNVNVPASCCAAAFSGTITAIASIALPNGTTYNFGYDVGGWGGLTSVQLPTGGQISYGYSTYTDMWNDINATNRWVTSRTSGGGTWSYVPQVIDNSSVTRIQQVSVTTPSGAKTIYQFSSSDQRGVNNTKRDYYESTGALLREDVIDYASVYCCPSRIATTFFRGDGSSISKKIEYGWLGAPSANDPTSVAVWDFYSGTPPATPLRTTTATYSNTNATFAAVGINDRPLAITVYQGSSSGSTVANASYSYDQSGLVNTNSGTCQSPAGAPNHDYCVYGYANTVRGNITQSSKWVSSSGLWISTSNTYDDLGNLLSSTDPGNHTTSYSYLDSWATGACGPANTYAYATQMTDALGHNTQTQYYACTGQVYLQRDQNDINAGRAGITHTYDAMGRPLVTTYSDGGQTSINYNGDPTPPHITKTVLATPDPNIITDDFYDGLGRITRTQLNDPEGADLVDTAYDANGRIYSVSNPYRSSSDPTYGTTYHNYDAFDRETRLTRQDGNTIQTDYSAFPAVTVTDETGRMRQSVSDALGRLTDVYEPNPSTGSLTSGDFRTHYDYDVLSNLIQVTQYGDGSGPARVRTFHYDSLSRLLDAYNPESGLTCYGTMTGSTCNRDGYDADGNLLYKTDARGLRTTHSYDQLHRLTGKSYSDGSASRQFFYDVTPSWWPQGPNPGSSIGRLTYATNDVNAAYGPSYDPMGRVVAVRYCIPSDCNYDLNVNASYDLAGNLTSLTYPSGRQITENYSGAGRLLNVTFASFNGTPVNYVYWSAQTPQYWPTGAVHLVALGNGTAEATDYNSRLQQVDALVGAPAGWSVNSSNRWMSKTYSLYDCCGHDNGNILTITDTLTANHTQQYGYDYLNRISMGLQNDGAFNQTFSVDPWGNLKQFGTAAFSPNFDGNNRIAQTGYNYDSVGNLLSDTFHTYTYDAESRIKTVDTNASTYTYDADGNRVRKDVGSDATEYIYFNGQPIAEYKPLTRDWSDYVYANGRRIVKADTFENGIHIQGNETCSKSQCWPNTWFRLSDASFLSGYTIQTGDKLYFRQYQQNARGGMGIFFKDGTNNVWNNLDQNGNPINDDPYENSWNGRIVDLSSYAGRVIDWIGLDNDANSPTGQWDIVYGDIALNSSDGTVRGIYNGSANFSVSLAWATGSSGASVSNRHISNVGWATFSTTAYYHEDQLGTSRLTSSYWGWPVWQGTFLPFGEEWNPQIATNHYKFTGKERDSESNLDYFGARYYASAMGRWMSPDWTNKPEPVPYADLNDPQSLNLYGYVANNPMSRADADGHARYSPFMSEDEKRRVVNQSGKQFVAGLAVMAAVLLAPEAVASAGPYVQGLLATTSGALASPKGQQLLEAGAQALAPPGPSVNPMQSFGIARVEGMIEDFSVGRLANGAEVAARITSSGENTTVGVLGAYNANKQEFAGTLEAIKNGADAVAQQNGSTSVTIQAIAITNAKLAKFLKSQGFVETTVKVGKESVKALEKTFQVAPVD